MPLSDDALNNWGQMATQACEAPPFMGRNNTKLYAAMVLDLVSELRAARKVVEAAKVLGIERAEAWRMAQHPKISAPHTAAYLIIAEPLDELQAALAEYNLLNASQPQPQKV